MSDPLDRSDELERALELAATEARAYLASLTGDHVQPPGSLEAIGGLGGELPQRGEGAIAALTELGTLGREAATRSSGPRFFHFVIGGATPAALAADWLASALDQNAAGWVASPLGTRLELVALDWLRELFGLPEEFGGVLVTGGTMANFICLAAGRDWCVQQLGGSAAETGLAGAPQVPVLTSGYVHASALKSLALLGLGRANVRRLARDLRGRLDLVRLAAELESLDGRPAIVIANAGEVNAGDFDPIEEMAELADRHGAWLHVDGAFGLFARLSPRSAHLAAGAERASSVSSDGHKWLNVPHDCGFAFVRETRWNRDRCPRAPPTSRLQTIPTPPSPTTRRKGRAVPGRSWSGRRCGPMAPRDTVRWWSATSSSPPTSRHGSTPSPNSSVWRPRHSTSSASAGARRACPRTSLTG